MEDEEDAASSGAEEYAGDDDDNMGDSEEDESEDEDTEMGDDDDEALDKTLVVSLKVRKPDADQDKMDLQADDEHPDTNNSTHNDPRSQHLTNGKVEPTVSTKADPGSPKNLPMDDTMRPRGFLQDTNSTHALAYRGSTEKPHASALSMKVAATTTTGTTGS
jgi:hypothetical protein